MRLYGIECTIERGAFTNERTFQIPLSDAVTTHDGRTDGQLVGTAHRDHLRDANKQPLDEDSPSYGTTMDGLVLCRKLSDLPDGRALVEVPSADIIFVPKDALDPVEQG